jgi:hypothetical protein
MDGSRFDQLSRLLGQGLNRRGAVRAALAAIAGGAIALDGEDAQARVVCRKGGYQCTRNGQCCTGSCATGRGASRNQRNRCACETGRELCGTTCVVLASDAKHCGNCGQRCKVGEACCNGRCQGVQTDPANCGRCGNACVGAEVCLAGSCIDLCQDVTCPANEDCVAGACQCGGVAGCAADEGCCGGTCRDLGADDAHCGACGTTCGDDESCVNGACVCSGGYTDCDPPNLVCVDTTSNASYCGDCSNNCGANATCVSGQCICDTGYDCKFFR